MGTMSRQHDALPLPEIYERLVAPESDYEIMDGRVVRVPPCDPPHAERHAMIAALLEAHVHDDYLCGIDLLTRTSAIDDVAPDLSIYPRAPHPETGGRQLEELVFEIVNKQHRASARRRAAKLSGRGVRRIVMIDVERGAASEWSGALQAWRPCEPDEVIVDPVLAVPLPIAHLLRATRPKDLMAKALRASGHAEFEDVRAEGRAENLLAVLEARGLTATAAERTAILHERDFARLHRWVARIATCASVAELLAD